MKLLKITSSQGYTVNGVRVYHQFSDTKHGFAHRIAMQGIGADWKGYGDVATYTLGKRLFAATTEYYAEALPAVFEVVKGTADDKDH